VVTLVKRAREREEQRSRQVLDLLIRNQELAAEGDTVLQEPATP